MFNLFQYVGFRYLKTKPSRVLLTTLGVAFGISLYVAIAIINHSTKDALRESVESISGKSKMSITAGPAGFDESKLEIIRTSAGVKQAIPMIESRAYFQGATSSAQGLVVLGVDLLQDTSVRSYKATDQRIIDDPLTFLNQPDSIVLTQALAQKKGLIIGSKINLATTVGAKTFTVRGLLEPDGAAKAYGGSLAIMDIDGARVMFGKENKLDRVDVITLPGANTDEVKATLEKTMGSGYTVETPESQSEQMQQMLDSYQIILTFFSSLALLVGLFLVMNSISVSIAERRREIGTLRALGATRGSMVILFISEVFGISLAGSLLGCGLGRLLANKLVSQVTASVSAQFQTRIDVSHLEFTRQQFLFSVSFGVLASMIAALIPALKAAKVHPLESMKKDAESFSHAEERRSTQTIFFGLGLLVFMTVSMMLHWEKLSPLLDGFTKISSVLGAALFGPFLVFLLIRLCRRLTHTVPNGVLRLSQENLIRSRRRTTSNVMALMVGLFLVMLIGSVRTSFHNTLMDWLGRVYVADIMVSSDGRMIMADVQPIKEEIEAEIKQVPGVHDIGPDHGMGMRIVPIRYRGKKMIIKAHDHYAEFYQYRNFGSDTVAAKKLYASENPQVMVTQSFLTRQHKQVGEFVDLDTPQGSLPFKIVGIVVDLVDRQLVGIDADD